MTSTTTPLGSDFPKQMVSLILDSIEKETLRAAQILWSILLTFISQNWIWILLAFFALFIVVTLKAMMGRWGSLGSFLYNSFYFGTLFAIGLIWGPAIFVEDYFNAACAVILYPICYALVGVLLEKIKVRRC